MLGSSLGGGWASSAAPFVVENCLSLNEWARIRAVGMPKISENCRGLKTVSGDVKVKLLTRKSQCEGVSFSTQPRAQGLWGWRGNPQGPWKGVSPGPALLLPMLSRWGRGG